jgi:Flp pilus assembly protein TadG
MITRLRHLLTLRCGRPLRDRRGAVMVEFALVVGPLLLLTFAIIELGLSYWAGGLLDNATQETARKIRTGELQAAAAGEETKTAQELFRENLCEAMDALIDCEDESRVYFDVRTFEDFEWTWRRRKPTTRTPASSSPSSSRAPARR